MEEELPPLQRCHPQKGGGLFVIIRFLQTPTRIYNTRASLSSSLSGSCPHPDSQNNIIGQIVSIYLGFSRWFGSSLFDKLGFYCQVNGCNKL